MDKAKVIKRVTNLNKIKGIVEIAKFDTLQKLAHARKVRGHHEKMSILSKEIITFAKNKYHLSALINRKYHEKQVKGNLWVYVTMTSSLIKASYEHFDSMISKDFNPSEDQIIVIGAPAIKFADRKGYDVLFKKDEIDHSSSEVSTIVNDALTNRLFSNIYIVANTKSTKDKPFKLFPIETDKKQSKKKFKNTKFYFSIIDSIINISASYVENSLHGIYQESYINFYQEKLVRHEGSLKNIDERIDKLKSQINKIHRKEETEEMIQVSQMTKRK